MPVYGAVMVAIIAQHSVKEQGAVLSIALQQSSLIVSEACARNFVKLFVLDPAVNNRLMFSNFQVANAGA